MSHSKERAEKNCLNCGETVLGRYCHVCGQENIVPKESIWGLVSHFFQDITHFDGKFFSTGKLLITKPGFLPKEYLSGKRARYLHPIRMYVFSSAVFFLIFYSVFDVRNMGLSKRKDKQEIADLAEAKARALKTAATKEDSAQVERTFRMIGQLPIDVKIDKNDISVEDEPEKEEATVKNDTTKNLITPNNDSTGKKRRVYRYDSTDTVEYASPADTSALAGRKSADDPNDSSRKRERSPARPDKRGGDFGLLDLGKAFTNAYDSRAEYDSAQAALPPDARDGWLNRRLAYQNIEFKQRYGDDQGALMQDLLDKFIHTFPYLLFISLPLYALFLKLLYIRRKQFYYADHALFLIYLYIFTFLHLLVFFGLRAVKQSWDYWWVGLIMFLFVLYGIYYAYKSMRKFYEQGRGKTILKFILFNILAFTTISLLFALFFFIALLRL